MERDGADVAVELSTEDNVPIGPDSARDLRSPGTFEGTAAHDPSLQERFPDS